MLVNVLLSVPMSVQVLSITGGFVTPFMHLPHSYACFLFNFSFFF